MDWKGRHDRNYIFVDINYSQSEMEIMYEEPAEGYGSFSVVGWYGDDEWFVVWRPSRNYTSSYYTKAMGELVASRWGNGQNRETITYPSFEEAKLAIANRWQEEFERPEKRKRHRPRDAQKSKLYRWEHVMVKALGPTEIVDGREFSKCEMLRDELYIRMLFNTVCSEMKIKAPKLKFRSGGSSSWQTRSEICLLPSHRTITVLLHELAHTLHGKWGDRTNNVKHQAHGQEFVGVFAYLLIRYAGIDRSALIRHANDSKIKIRLHEKYWDWKEAERKAA